MTMGKTAGTAADVLVTRIPGAALIWLGLANRGAARLTYQEARELGAALSLLADQAEADLARAVEE